jgi:hypothetical protein
MLVVLCLIYVLSIGPALVLEEKKMISKSSFELIYSPLQKAADKLPAADKALKAYMHLWK